MHNLARPTFYYFVEHELIRRKQEQEKDKYVTIASEAFDQTPKVTNSRSSSQVGHDRSLMSVHYERIRFDPPHKMWLFVTMRGIFDCKYSEHKILGTDPRGLYNVQRFPGKCLR